MLHFLAIDIGGSKTNLVIFDEMMNRIKINTAPGFGESFESDEDMPEFEKAVLDTVNGEKISSVAVNLGGKNKNQVYKAVKKCLPESSVTVFRESEGVASVQLAKYYGAECVLLSGTGTIVTAFDVNGKIIISGGWGMNIGDGGSGYYIGLEAVRRSLKALDGCDELTPLQKEITGRDSVILPSSDISEICNNRDEVRSGIFPIERKKIAALAVIVAKHCENGEEDALEIMMDAGREMAEICVSAVNKLLPYKVRKLVVTGGLTGCRRFWQDEFEKTVKFRSAVNEFEYVNDGVLFGTELAAIEYAKEI